jgi:hypothetical protein
MKPYRPDKDTHLFPSEGASPVALLPEDYNLTTHLPKEGGATRGRKAMASGASKSKRIARAQPTILQQERAIA